MMSAIKAAPEMIHIVVVFSFIAPVSVGLLQPISGSIKARSKTPVNITGMAFQSGPPNMCLI